MVCDWWECANVETCRRLHPDSRFLPCAMCPRFDKCEVCTKRTECMDLMSKYTPNMVRRLVREIRTGEDTTMTEQYINRHTLGGKKRGIKK